MKKILLMCLVVALSGCKTVSTKKSKEEAETPDVQKVLTGKNVFATAVLHGRSGSQVSGKVWFLESKEGIMIFAKAKHLTPGKHGIHIHDMGSCEGTDAVSAGIIFNPTHMTHGGPNPKKHYIGDLGNIKADKTGSGVLMLAIPKSQFHSGFRDWKKIVGKSLVIHANQDDLTSQPEGMAGKRVACGIIEAH